MSALLYVSAAVLLVSVLAYRARWAFRAYLGTPGPHRVRWASVLSEALAPLAKRHAEAQAVVRDFWDGRWGDPSGWAEVSHLGNGQRRGRRVSASLPEGMKEADVSDLIGGGR